MYTILQKLDVIEQQLATPAYRGTIQNGSIYFIAADEEGWVPATKLQAQAIYQYTNQNDKLDLRINLGVDDSGKQIYFNFIHIGDGQNDRRCAIQDRTYPNIYREFIMFDKRGIKIYPEFRDIHLLSIKYGNKGF